MNSISDWEPWRHSIHLFTIMNSLFQTENAKDSSLMDKQALAVVRDLQRLRGINGEYESDGSSAGKAGRRPTIANIARGNRRQSIGTLDVAFKKRFFSIAPDNPGDNNREYPLIINILMLTVRDDWQLIMSLIVLNGECRYTINILTTTVSAIDNKYKSNICE